MSRRAEIDPEIAERWYELLGKWRLVAERMTPPGRLVYKTDSVMNAVRKWRMEKSDGRQSQG